MYVPCFTTCDYTFYVHYLIYPFLVNLTLFNELDDSIFRRKLRNCQDWSSHLVANAKSIVPLSPWTQIHGWAIRPAYPALSIFKFRPFLANSQLHRTATFPRGKWTSRCFCSQLHVHFIQQKEQNLWPASVTGPPFRFSCSATALFFLRSDGAGLLHYKHGHLDPTFIIISSLY